MAQVKPEIKLDPADSPGGLADIEEFDAFMPQLEIPTREQQGSGAWLVKVPEQLWKAWNDVYQNEPEVPEESGYGGIQVGTLRVFHQKEGEAHQRIQVRLRREPDDDGWHPQNAEEQERKRRLAHDRKRLIAQKLLPEVYELEMRSQGYNNTVVFSEQDLEGHRAQQPGGSKLATSSRPSGIQAKGDRYGPKRPGTYRTAIPKKTALAPTIAHEAIANPVEDDTSMDFFKLQYDTAMNAGKRTTILNRVEKGGAASASNFTFGTLTSKPKSNKKKPVKEKAVRMDKNELLDRMQKCFKQYAYWSLRALRNELGQPEAWLKEVLEDIAIPIRSGDFIGQYRLTEQSARLLAIQAESQNVAPVPPGDEDGATDHGSDGELGDQDDDEDGDEVDMFGEGKVEA